MIDPSLPLTTRRDVLQLGACLGGAALLSPWALAGATSRQDHPVLRVGLVGCGGRGTGAAVQALRADPHCELVAMGDAFSDRVEASLASVLRNGDVAPRVKVDPAHCFSGFDAFREVTDRVDVVLLASPPHFRPEHVEYAVEKGKHLFVEKPVATDPAGVRRIWAACEAARAKDLSLVSGLCYRYQFAKRATVRLIHEGLIGRVRTLQCSYNTGGLWHRGRGEDWSEMEYQVRNWLYFTWLSGDFITEQHIHSLDKLAWAMGDRYPVKATASGGRIQRTGEQYGDAYDHFNTVYEWEDGAVGFSSCRQWSGCAADVSDHVYGTEGVAHLQTHAIELDNGDSWRYRPDEGSRAHLKRGGADDMYQNEHDALFWSIRNEEPINDGEYMCKSTLMAIMARLSAYTGTTVTWQQAWDSELDLSPRAYAWGGAPQCQVAVPGVTKFV